MPPLADFACLAKKCRGEQGAPTYELPITATRCPVCGSKRLQRLWTPPAVLRGAQPEPVNLRSSSMAKNLDRLAGPEIERMEQAESAVKDARTSKRVGRSFAVPLAELPATVARLGGQAQAVPITAGASNVTPGQFHPVQNQMRGLRPASGSLVDTKLMKQTEQLRQRAAALRTSSLPDR